MANRNQLEIVRESSKLQSKPMTLVVGGNDESSREYFKYESGRLVEYELTRVAGKNIFLPEEEEAACQDFFKQ